MKLSILYYIAFTAAYIQKRATDPCIIKCLAQVEAKGPKCSNFLTDEVAMKQCVCAQDSTYWDPLVECVADCPAYADKAEAGASSLKASICAANAQVEPIVTGTADDEDAAETDAGVGKEAGEDDDEGDDDKEDDDKEDDDKEDDDKEDDDKEDDDENVAPTSSKTSAATSSKTSSATSSKTSSTTSSNSATGSRTTGSQTSAGSTSSTTGTKSTTSGIPKKGSAAEIKIDSLMGLLMLALF